ncbi:MAG TPA: phosphate acyltransferase [Candidatus Polarisedimenticolaceae bacterium]|nr:phosphate acyltransferase [Candidatus Polarisedimenticolaceae bacterium]
MNVLDAILSRARRDPVRIAMPEGEDPRVLRAALRLARERIATPLLVGEAQTVRLAAERASVELGPVAIVEPGRHAAHDRCAHAAREALAPRGATAEEVERCLGDPLYYAASMVRAGLADGTLAGATHSTAETLRAALRIIGPARSTGTVSSFFLMALRQPTSAGDDVLAFADCGLIPYPDAAQLATIARQTAAQFRLLVEREPRVALLSFSTAGSASHPSVDSVRAARDLLAAGDADFEFDGEMQVDAALVPDVARAKLARSPVAGRANVLIFPNLDAGNIAYKLVERLAGATALGPLVQGLARPFMDLSRGCKPDDIVSVACIASALAD